MDLSIREAAALLRISACTLRARVARGDIPGKRHGKTWVVDRRDLPLTEAQRQVLQARAADVRAAVDAILPSRLATTPDRTHRSLADLDVFRGVVHALHLLRADAAIAGGAVAATWLQAAAAGIGEASFVYERERKQAALSDARAAVGRAVAVLLAEGGLPIPDGTAAVVVALEGTVAPMLAGYARWVASLPGRR